MKLKVLALFLCAGAVALANRAGLPNPPVNTGAPGQQTCARCHGDGTVNTGGGSTTVTVLNATTYTPGQQYTLRITTTDSTARRWGFGLTARSGTDNTTPAGTFAVNAGDSSTQASQSNTAMSHTAAGVRDGQSGSSSWDVLWTAPSASVGTVTFFLASNAANGNDARDPGDHIYSATLALPVAGGGAAVTAGNRVLPQLAFGGGWSTTLYFGSIAGAAQTISLRFYDGNGQPLPINGSPTADLNVPAGGTASFTAPNSGSLQQGWATFDLPDGMSGYGVFRQTVSGRPDQEALVTYSRSNATKATIVWDERGSVRTAVSLVNPTNSAVSASVIIKDSSGATIIAGPLPVSLPAGGKATFVVRDLIPTVVGKYGTAEISVASGAGSLVALRFDDAGAITTIPVQEN